MILSITTKSKDFKELSLDEYQEVFNEYYDNIRGFLYFKLGDRDLAEDIAQDTFFKLWENRKKIDLNTVKSYLYTIANNLAINHLKRQQLRYKFENNSPRNHDDQSPQYLMEMGEYQEKLQAVLASIPDGAREVFLMNRLEDMKYREIAERLDLSVKAVEKRMSKALSIIKEKLGVSI